jgi:hypothetical protein
MSSVSLNILDCEESSDGAVISLSINHEGPGVTPPSCKDGKLAPPRKLWAVTLTLTSEKTGEAVGFLC